MGKKLTAKEKRKREYARSVLPFAFDWKIRKYFTGEPCPVCNVTMDRHKYGNSNIPTIQHNKPISKGGKHNLNNISVICYTCNSKINNNNTTGSLNNLLVRDTWKMIIKEKL